MFGTIEPELLAISLFGDCKKITLWPEQIWSELWASGVHIGSILEKPLHFQDGKHEGRDCIVISNGYTQRYVGDEIPDMSLVLAYCEEIARNLGEEQTANIIAGARIWHTQQKLAFKTTARLSDKAQQLGTEKDPIQVVDTPTGYPANILWPLESGHDDGVH